MIIKKYKPEKIYQWGSLLNKKHFSEISDIDIAVQGIGNVGKFFAMFGEADIMTKFDLDLLDIDKIDSIHAESIKKNGRIVYERI
jgi:predicted nucleotidyltransferase